jgi:hypothetical protein
MNIDTLWDRYYEDPSAVVDEIKLVIERARVVGVLDAWSDRNPSKEPFSTWRIGATGERKYCCASQFNRSGERSYFGPTADAARAAAAKAIEAGEAG